MLTSKAPGKPNIMRDLEQLNPHTNRIMAIIWRWGFLMGFLNSLFEESNWVQWRWRRHIERKLAELD